MSFYFSDEDRKKVMDLLGPVLDQIEQQLGPQYMPCVKGIVDDRVTDLRHQAIDALSESAGQS